MNATSIIRSGAVLAIASVFAVGGTTAFAAATPGPVSPSPTPTTSTNSGATLASVKARCDGAVQRRLGALRADADYVNAATTLASADKAALSGQISADQKGLTDLDVTIQADTTIAQTRIDCQKIVADYHVFVLEEPKIHEVIAADAITAANAGFTKLIPELQALINSSTVSSDQKAKAQTALNDLQAKVTASSTSVGGVVASIINLTPSGYPGNDVQLKSAAANIKTAHTDLDGARADVTTILHALGH